MKILVNNEEVVSNSNLQIKEEMLSTSSTILKNCYPKTWEEDKDYVSRYYFPKDYSKCKIVNEIEHPEIPGTTTKGTNLNINYDDSLKWELNGLFGDTFQQTYTGKNLNVYPYATTGGAGNGITFTINTDGTVILNGKNNGNGNSSKYFYNNANNPLILPAGTYYMAKPSNTNVTYVMYDGTSYYNFNNNNNYSWTFNEQKSIRTFYIQVAKNNTTQFSYLKVYPMLSTTRYTENDYEPYVGGIPSPNPSYPQSIENVTGLQNIEICGKNLLNADSIIPAMINSQSYSSSTLVYDNVTKTLTMTNPNTDTYLPAIYNNANNIPSVNINVKKNTTYTLHFDIDQPSSTWKNCVMGLDKSVNKYKYITNLGEVNTITFNTGNYDTIAFRIGSKGSVGTVTKFSNFQLEEGSSVTEYEPYKGNTYEVNLGKNLFDKDNGNYVMGTLGVNYKFEVGTTNKCLYIPCKPNTTYTVQKRNDGDTNRFAFSSSEVIPTNNSTLTTRVGNNDASSLTLTTGANDKYLIVQYYRIYETVLTEQQLLDSIQIEVGSQATSYSPYFTPIELNKIEDYEDKIYKDNGKWYVEKNTRKLELAIADMNNSENSPGWKDVQQIKNDYNGENNQLSRLGIGYYSNINVPNNSNDYVAINTLSSNKILFLRRAAFGNDYTQTYWKTNYSNLIFSMVYGLKTPEITEITNEELINQLEAIQLLKGTNNISITSENLSMPIEIHYNFKEAWTEEELIFSGLVKNTGKISLNPRQPHYVDLQILDFKDLLSTGETLNYVISGKTITEAINQVVSSISDYGFVVGNINIVNPNELIGAYSTLNKTAYDVFQYIADITQSRWSTRVIDENTIAIDFNDPSLMEEGTPIESTQEFYEDNEINDISFSYSTNDYRNKQIITSDEVYGNVLQTETKVADGYTKTFVCENKIGTITGITLNGVNATFITKNDEALGLSGDFIYQPGETTFISSNTIATGGVIVISYYPIVKGREIVINSTEISRINNQINRKGTISRYENRNDSTSSQELIKIGQSYIKYKGQAEITLKVVSTKNIWNIGQIVSYNAPLEELTTDYMVKSKTIDMYLNANKTFYTYELTSNYNYENAINYFDNQRAKNQGNIGEGEVITRNIDLESTALIKFYDTSIEEVSIGTDSTLDFQLDSVII